MGRTIIVAAAVVVGIISLIFMGFGFLALADIWQGEGDLMTEWHVVRAMWVIAAVAQILMLGAISRLIHDRKHRD